MSTFYQRLVRVNNWPFGVQRIIRMNDWPFGVKIGTAMIALSVLPLLIISLLPTNAADALKTEAFNHLETVSENRRNTIQLWFDERRSDVRVLSTTTTVIDAMRDFESGYHELGEGDHTLGLNRARELYLNQPDVENARDGSSYSTVHARYYSVLTQFSKNYGYYDAFLIDTNGGIMFSVEKRDDFGTNLLTGPYRDSNLARVFQRTIAARDPDFVVFEDFERYAPSGNISASFIATPVYDGNRMIGVFAVQLPLDTLSTIMNDRVGLGNSGETYLVGPDHLFRSDSRFLDDLGVTSTVLNPEFPVNTKAANAALRGEHGVELSRDYRGVRVLSSWYPLVIEEPVEGESAGLTWAVIAEIDEDEVLVPSREQRRIDYIAAGIAGLSAVGFAVLFTTLMLRQIREIDHVFSEIRVGEFDTRARIFSQDELGQTAAGVNALLDLFQTLLDENEAETQERIRSMALLGIAWETDAEGRFTYVSESVADVLGYTATDLTGTTRFDLMTPEEAARIQAVFEAAMAQQQPVVDLENWVSHRSGQAVCLLTYGLPILDDDGELTGFRGADKDITSSKQAEQALLEAEERYRTVADFAYGWEYWESIDGEMLYISPGVEDIIGYPRETFVEKPGFINELILAEDKEAWEDHHHAVVDAPGRHSVQFRLRTSSGGIRWIEHTCRAVVNDQGQLQGWRATNQDITARQRVIEDVENAASQATRASETMAEVVRLMVEQAHSSAQMAEQATISAQEGDQTVNHTIAAMSRIRENTQDSARRIKRLGEMSQEISEIVRLIEELSDRTTILALNASIQAAAAGEAGRGFAVVAEEVQRLAERATGATRDIENLVKSIQSETNDAVRSIEESTREVVDGSELAQQAGSRMAELNNLINQLAQRIQETSETTAYQTDTSVTALTDLLLELQTTVSAFGTSAHHANGDQDDHGEGHRRPVGVRSGSGNGRRSTTPANERA